MIAVIEDLDDFADELWIGCSRGVKIEDAASSTFIHVTNCVSHSGARILGKIESSEREPRIAGFAKRAARFEHLDLHGVIGVLEALEQSLFEFRPGTLEEMDQFTVISDSCLIEAIVYVVSEINNLAVGRVFIS